jgi:hypothetical protein
MGSLQFKNIYVSPISLAYFVNILLSYLLIDLANAFLLKTIVTKAIVNKYVAAKTTMLVVSIVVTFLSKNKKELSRT